MKTTTRDKYALVCMATDGEYVREGTFPDIESAWSWAGDMGSRWFFYPVCLVTGLARSNKAKIAAVPDGMPEAWIGKTLHTLGLAFQQEEEHVCDYVNGQCPLMLFP